MINREPTRYDSQFPVAERIRDFKTRHWQNADVSRRYVEVQSTAKIRLYDQLILPCYAHFCAPQSRILEVGAGPGTVSLHLAQLGHRVVATDVSRQQLSALEAQRGSLDIEIRVADAYELPSEDGEFDVVVSRQFLCHFKDWPRLVGEMARCCRPGGRILTDAASAEHTRIARSPSFSQQPDEQNPGVFYDEVTHQDWLDVAGQHDLNLIAHFPFTFFRDNHLFSKAMGSERYKTWEAEFQQRLTHPAVFDFVRWFEQSVTLELPLELGYEHFIALEKKPSSRA
jgi:ubiquinone/menaquinone biosynthesis C-methylase UbiE